MGVGGRGMAVIKMLNVGVEKDIFAQGVGYFCYVLCTPTHPTSGVYIILKWFKCF